MDIVFLCWQDLLDHCIVDLRDTDYVLYSYSILRNVYVSYLRQIDGVLDCLGFKSVHGSLHWENESLDVCLVKDDVCNLGDVDWALVGWDVLFNMNESYLGDFYWVFFGGNDLLDDHKVDLRNFDRVLIGWHDLLDRNKSNLRKLDWEFLCFCSFDFYWLDDCRIFDYFYHDWRWRRNESCSFDDWFNYYWSFDNDWSWLFNNDRSWLFNMDWSWLLNNYWSWSFYYSFDNRSC